MTFVRRLVASQPPLEGVALASPLSISADAAAGSLRLELSRIGAPGAAGDGLLDEVIARVSPALFADGRIRRIEIGLVTLEAARDAVDSDGATTEWAIVRPGLEHPC